MSYPKITLHDEHPHDSTEDSLSRLVQRQADAMEELREQKSDLLNAIKALRRIGAETPSEQDRIVAQAEAAISKAEGH